jgi:outer membrane receptor protein involved in Fe transport
MKIRFRGASRAALLAGVAMGAPAWAQTVDTVQTSGDNIQATGPQQAAQPAPAPQTTTPAAQEQEPDRVTVIGSLIATTAEDQPKPVEVITAEDLREAGTPNITEFVRSLTSASPNLTGNNYTNTGANILGSGFNSVDLRGQGANGTLVLMNGRRLATTNGGAGADVNTIPMEALGGIEILKDGASPTYGAGAVGGVINFRTRRDVDSPQINYERTLYDGSDGRYKVSLMTGWVGDASNLLIVASHEHEDSLMMTERDYSTAPYELNPALYSLANVPQRFHLQANAFATFVSPGVTASTVLTPGVNVSLGVPATGTVSGSFNDFTSAADCHTLGGELVQTYQHGTGGTTPTACGFPLAPVTELVSESSQSQIFAEFNSAISDTMEFHFDFTYSKYDSTGKRPPSGANGLSARTVDSSVSATCASSCFIQVPYQQNTYTTAGLPTATVVVNPFVADFNARQPGTTNDLAPGGSLYTSANWRPYLFGGNPLWDDGFARSHVQRERYLANVGLNGEFSEGGLLGFLKGIHYDFNAQYNMYVQANVENGDWLVDRLQDAIMGYGGPNCRAVDRVRTDFTSAFTFNRTVGIQSDTAPGTNGCMWFNPFQSNFQSSIFNGAANPNFPASGQPNWGANATQVGSTGVNGYLNDKGLVDWIWASRRSEIQYQAATFDLVFSGEVPAFELPGGPIGYAVGSQWRLTERRGMVQADQAELALLLERCPYDQQPGPLSRACSTLPVGQGSGPGDFFSGATAIQPNPGLNPPDYIESQTIAFLAELQLPIFDRLNASLSWRHESFNGGDLDGTIWGVAAKYDITDDLYIRGSYTTNFRAEGVLDAVPGAQTITSVSETSASRFGTFTYSRLITTEREIAPEDDSTMNLGVGYNTELFGGRLRATANFFKIDVEGQEVTTSATTVLGNVFHQDSTLTNANAGPNPETDTTRVGTLNYRADCSSRLSAFILWRSGSCVQGTTTGADIDYVLSSDQNGPSLHTQGIDYSIDYSHPLLGGYLSFGLDWTVYMKYEADGYSVNGIPFDLGGDRLGFFNGLQTGSASQKQRVNSSLRWANDEHSFGVLAHYQSGYNDDPTTFDFVNNVLTTQLTPTYNAPGTTFCTGLAGQVPGVNCDAFSGLLAGGKDYVDYDVTYIWTPKIIEGWEFRASILNLTDRDPVLAQFGNGTAAISGFVPQLGNPRGRRIEFGFTKKF